MQVAPSLSAGSSEYAGTAYHFCSIRCRDKFEADPQQFFRRADAASVSKELAQPDSAAMQKGEYTCPMHPEIHQNHSGSCPKCGMALEPVAPILAVAKTEYVCPMHPEIVRSEPGNCPICGMTLEPRVVSASEEASPELANMTRRFWISVVVTLPLILIEMSDMIPGQPVARMMPGSVRTWIELALATPVVLWAGSPLFVRGWQSIVNHSLNMFTLIGMGIGVAYGYSLFAAVFPNLFLDSFHATGGAGLIGVADPIKASTAEALKMLQYEGVKIVVLTGDNRITAAAAAKELGIDEFEAEVMPDQKALVVKRLQSEGRIVAMAGDGINDAPALAQAQVGIAMGTGTDVAMESAGVTLVKGDLRNIAALCLRPLIFGKMAMNFALRMRSATWR